jgi:hypothetical protein
MSKSLMIGLLLSRDDGDIIEEVMTEYCRHFDVIYALDSSRDGSLDVIRSYDKVVYAAHEDELGIKTYDLKDGVRQLLLSRIQQRYGTDGWIFAIHTDEIYAIQDMTHLMECAEAEDANHISCLPAHFVLHISEKGTPGVKRLEGRVQDSRLWYFFALCESAGFKNQKGLHYTFGEHMKAIPNGLGDLRTCSRIFIRRHYNARTEDQVRARVADRLATGWQPAYSRWSDNVYVSSAAEMAEVVYSDLQQYDGTWRFLPEHEDWWERIEL